MNQSVKRTGAVSFAGLPAMDDKALAELVAALPLSEDDHRKAVLLTAGLIPGKFGLLARQDRDWLIKKAMEAGAMPKVYRRPPGQKCLYAEDPYSDRESEALQKTLKTIASQVPSMGGKLPTPPPRRNW